MPDQVPLDSSENPKLALGPGSKHCPRLSSVVLNMVSDAREYSSIMDKKEINSPKTTANFLIWICGVGGLCCCSFSWLTSSGRFYEAGL
jgi:hypothetical protein